MTIEHKTTHGPHRPGQLAADWMVETGQPVRAIADRVEVSDRIRVAVPHHDLALTLESAAALRDALTVHLRNMGWDDPETDTAPAGLPAHLQPASHHPHGVFNIYQAPAAPEVIKVAESIRDAYADNARTIGPREVGGITEAEAHEIGELKRNGLGVWEDPQGILYTDGAELELRVKARRHRDKLEASAKLEDMEAEADRNAAEFNLASPVNKVGNGADIFRNTVRGWTDEECRGAWNHAMEDTPKPGCLTDRPSGREYTPLAAITLRDRLNQINGADADRG